MVVQKVTEGYRNVKIWEQMKVEGRTGAFQICSLNHEHLGFIHEGSMGEEKKIIFVNVNDVNHI